MLVPLVAWRYLYSPKPNRRAVITAIVSLVTAAAGSLLFLYGPKGLQIPSAIIAVLSMLVGLVAALLRFFTPFATISVTSVLIGTGVLAVVWSVSHGFQDEFKRKILGVNGHILIINPGIPMDDWHTPVNVARQTPGVVDAAPFTLNEMLAMKDGRSASVLLKGVQVDRVGNILDLPRHLLSGSLKDIEYHPDTSPKTGDRAVPDDSEETDDSEEADDSEETARDATSAGAAAAKQKRPPCTSAHNRMPGVLVGRILAGRLNLKPGDALTLVSPFSELAYSSDESAPALKSVDVCVRGIFYAGFEEYDRKLIYTDIRLGRLFNPIGPSGHHQVFGVEMRLTDMEAADSVAAVLRTTLPENYKVVTWKELNPQVFSSLQFQKLVVWLLLFFLILVAAFGVLSALYMMVLDKRREISILKALGATDSQVGRIFVGAGLFIGILGTVLGEGLGLVACMFLRSYSFPLDPEVYFLSVLPVSIDAVDFIMIAVTTLVLTLLATALPSLKASRAVPLDGLVVRRQG